MLSDAELLRRYAQNRDERAFHDFVQRHAGLVYGAALRRSNGRVHLAEEVVQQVFIKVAHHSAALSRHPALLGWLHRSTRHAVIDTIRTDLRQQKLRQSLATMPDAESSIEWEQLQPEIDQAMDQLKARDRELMLLRFFAGLTFAEIGGRLNLSENSTRMRTARALERLRHHLSKRGIKSTGAALGLLLANQTLSAAPASLVGAVLTAALSTPPATGFAGILSHIIMNKTPLLILSTSAAILVATVAATTVAAGSDAVAITSKANPQNLAAITRSIEVRHTDKTDAAQPTATDVQHANHGLATPLDAFKSLAWASDTANVTALAGMLCFDDASRAKALEIMAALPESFRAEYDTPEKFYAFLTVAHSLISGPPAADVLQHFSAVEITPDHYAIRRADSSRNFQEYHHTPEGWKWFIPVAGVEALPRILTNPTLLKLVNR